MKMVGEKGDTLERAIDRFALCRVKYPSNIANFISYLLQAN